MQAKHDQVETLEATQSLTLTELQERHVHNQRLRHTLLTEQRTLQDLVAQKKETILLLQRQLQDLRRDAEKHEVLLKKQVKELSEKLLFYETEREKSKKEHSKLFQREISQQVHHQHLNKQVKDLQKALQQSEQMIRSLQLKIVQLEQSESELSQSTDKKGQQWLRHITKLEEEISKMKGLNMFLKQQLSATTQQVGVLSEQAGEQWTYVQQSLSRSLSMQQLTAGNSPSPNKIRTPKSATQPVGFGQSGPSSRSIGSGHNSPAASTPTSAVLVRSRSMSHSPLPKPRSPVLIQLPLSSISTSIGAATSSTSAAATKKSTKVSLAQPVEVVPSGESLHPQTENGDLSEEDGGKDEEENELRVVDAKDSNMGNTGTSEPVFESLQVVNTDRASVAEEKKDSGEIHNTGNLETRRSYYQRK